MNTFKRLGVSVLLLLVVGCTTMMGPYGPVPTWDAERIAGAGTGAILGTLAGAVVGNPVGGAMLGASVGGAMPSYGYYQTISQQLVCNIVDIGGVYTPFGQYVPNYQVVCR